MVAPKKRRSLGLPIILSGVAVALTITLLLAWILVIVSYVDELSSTLIGNVGLLVGGIISFAAILTVLVMFTVFLVREISEVRRQTSFIDSVTHELKTPLASLKLAVETLARPQLAPDRREQLRVMMLQDVSRLVSLVDDILDASRLLDGRVEGGELAELVVADLIDRVVSEVLVRHNGVEQDCFEFELEPDLVLSADPTALRTILSNLIDNAIKYSDGTPRIHVRARSEGAHVIIEVRDQGIGIEKGDLKRIFQRFYRVNVEAVRARHGTGLGLFVVAALVKGIGGKISAASEGLGHGTTITVRLPAKPRRR